MQVFADDGACVDVRVDGSNGAAVVLIAGFPLTREIWNAQSETLSERFRIVRPELRGVAESSVPDGPYLMERLAADVATALDTLGIERAAIAGHSLGGYVALAFARMFSERVTRLALICSRLTADAPEQASTRRALADRVERESSTSAAVDAYVPRLTAPGSAIEFPEMVARVRDIAERLSPSGAASLLRGMAMRCDARDIAPELDVPVLVIAGAKDAVLSMEEARATSAAFRRGRLIVCANSGHLPMLEEPDSVSTALAEWLSE
jgi:pimeloyl-ACP methyl ester carboxylesterase